MDAAQIFKTFVERTLVPDQARRFGALAETKAGHRKILDALCHQFGNAIRPTSVRSRDYAALWTRPCCVYYEQSGFGVEFMTLREAYDNLSSTDGWLILLTDGSAGIHRPESRWDDEQLIIA